MALSANVMQAGTLLGPLQDTSTFDAYRAYNPGQVAVDTNVPYIATNPVGGSLVGADSFIRRDASRWDVSTGGQQWLPYVQSGDSWTNTILANVGVLSGTATASAGGVMLLDAAASGTDRDVLVRASIDAEAAIGDVALLLVLGSDTDQQNYSMVSVALGNAAPLVLNYLHLTGGTAASTSGTGGVSPLLGDVFYVRARRQGSNVYVRTWLDGTVEPSTWDLTTAFVSGTYGNRSGVGFSTTGGTGTVTYRAASVRAITAATAPSSDSANWLSLTAAFPNLAPI